jgi:16S rRNA (cytosine967-C5)-methyltransferase
MSPARDVAFRILKRVHGGGYASDLVRRQTAELDTRDAALAETLVFGCLRFQAQLDFLIELFSGRAQPKLDEEVRIALRLGIYQLRYLERIPAHAAVAESVELVKRAHKRSAAGLVNAVLRKVTRKPVNWPDEATGLSIPAWILEHWKTRYGPEQASQIARVALREPPTVINPITGRRQDPASQQIAPLLAIEPGMALLDVCAAPGNKTAQALAEGARVVACDRHLARIAEVPNKAMRIVADASIPLPFATKFDRILVDAPCSGTGTLARNPEIKWRLQPSDLARFSVLQRSILQHALDLLKPEGRLVYSTCSLEAEENEHVIAGLSVTETRTWLPGVNSEGDGFFAAIIAPSMLGLSKGGIVS